MKLVASLVVCLALAVSQIQAVRIKIQLTKESTELYRAHIAKRQTSGSACDDTTVVERSSLTLPGDLNQLNERVKFYNSTTATTNLDLFQNQLVPGLGGLSVRDVLNVLRNQSCPSFIYGGAVRDQYLNKQPNDADIEVDCTLEHFFNVCVAAWGPSNCRTRPGSRPTGHVGNETVQPDLPDVDLTSTGTTILAPLTQLEYTMNSLAYDLNGLDVIIDLPGTGQMDACNRQIRIPSDDDSLESWNNWVNRIKAYRYWKLRTKGLEGYNVETHNFIVNRSMRYIQDDPDSFADFYCDQVYDAGYDATNKKCVIRAAACENGNADAATYNATFAEDFGDFWNDYILQNAFPSLADCLSDSGAIPTEYSVKVLAGLISVAILTLLF